MKNNKIAVCGNIASGKTTIAKHLATNFGYGFHSFGNGIRDCFNDCFVDALGRKLDKTKDRRLLEYIGAYARGFNWGSAVYFDEDKYLIDNGLEHLAMVDDDTNPFWAMFEWIYKRTQELYTKEERLEMEMSSRDPVDFWIRLEFSNFNKDNIVVDDCRYHNELRALKQAGFKVIRLNASEDTCAERATIRDGGFDRKSFHTAVELQHHQFEVDYEIDADRPLNQVLADIDKLIEV